MVAAARSNRMVPPAIPANSDSPSWSAADHLHVESMLADGPDSGRDLADFVHVVCHLYGHHPTMVELALAHAPDGAAREWMRQVVEAFETERSLIVTLSSAVGPIPSTPGAAQTENAVQAQRSALETLANSERRGCALGAATALVRDWVVMRELLDVTAARAGVTAPDCTMPDAVSCDRVIIAAVDGAAMERGLRFGIEQSVLQHRAMFDLLEARSTARIDADG